MPLIGTRGAASSRGFGRFGGSGALFDFTSYTFTTVNLAEYQWHTGPTLAQLQTQYSGSTFIGNTAFFNVTTQGVQEFTIPKDGTYRITAVGGSGGDGAGADYGSTTNTRGSFTSCSGGRAASMRGDFVLTASTVLCLVVGQQGRQGTGNANCGGGGGGGSFVYKKSDNTLLIAAGGGGGNNGATSSMTNTPSSLIHGNSSTSGQQSSMGTAGGVGGNPGESYGGGGGTYNGAGGAGWNGSAYYSGGENYGKGRTQGWLGGLPANNITVGGFGGGGGAADDGRSTYSHGAGGAGGYSGGGGAYYTGYAGGGGSYNNGSSQSNASASGGVNTHGSITIAFLG